MQESHPVPQNVTSFEFHLVGDMTLKQFTYLAIGLAIAYLTFVFGAKGAPYVAWPVIIVSAALGASFAFLPIGERPLDHWTVAFIQAIFRPTQRRYKSKLLQKDTPQFKNRLQIYLNSIPAPQPNTVLKTALTPVQPQTATAPQTATSNITPPTTQNTSPPNPPQAFQQPAPEPELPSQKELKKAVGLAKEAQAVQAKIIEDEKKLEEIKRQAAQPGADPNKFTKPFEAVLSDLQELNKEASSVSKDLAVLSRTQTPPPPAAKAPVQIVPTLSLTSIPNIINGIITDSRGNYLEGAIIVAHDSQGLPVRALKSNKLGQFITATPLPDGIYTLSAEKDQLAFSTYQIELKGEILSPMVITALKGGVA